MWFEVNILCSGNWVKLKAFMIDKIFSVFFIPSQLFSFCSHMEKYRDLHIFF